MYIKLYNDLMHTFIDIVDLISHGGCNKFYGLNNTNVFSYGSGGQSLYVFHWDDVSVSSTMVPLEILGENTFSCLFQPLEAALHCLAHVTTSHHIFLLLPWSHGLFPLLSSSLLLPPSPKHNCDHLYGSP